MSLKGSNHFQRQKKKITTEYTLSKDRKMICTSEQHFSSFQSAKTRRISAGLAVKSALYNSIVDSNFQRILHGAACSSTADPPGSRISFSLARLSNICSPNSNGGVMCGQLWWEHWGILPACCIVPDSWSWKILFGAKVATCITFLVSLHELEHFTLHRNERQTRHILA